MANAPTLQGTKRAILDEIARYKVRGGEIFPIMQVNVNLQKLGYRADDINPALDEMVKDCWLEASDGPHWKITDLGFSEL